MSTPKTRYETISTESVPVNRNPNVVLTKVPVDKPINVPIEPLYDTTVKTSINYKIDDLDGQKVREWFRDDFGANRTIELQPKLKSDRGFVKGKIVVDPSDKAHINITEDIEIQTTIDTNEAQFKIKPRELSAVFDMGIRPIGLHWLNPYIGITIPRSSTSIRGANSLNLGFIFHNQPSLTSRLRSRFELILQQAEPEKKLRTEIDFKANIAYYYSNFVFGLYEAWSLTSGFGRVGRVSIGARQNEFGGFAQLELKDRWTLSGLLLGASYRPIKDLTFFGQVGKSLLTVGDEKTTAPARFAVGAEWQHCSGFSTKLAYHHQSKVQSVFNFILNRHVTASLMFDSNCVDCKRPDGKSSFSWGAKIKANI